jgi:hypothetical protein
MNASADPRLIAAIRAHKGALAAGATPAPRRRFAVTMAPRVPSPPEPAPTPPTPPDPTPPDPTPDPGTTVPTGSPFTPDVAAAIYKAREEVLRRIGVSRVSALDVHTNAGSEVTSLLAPTRSAPVGWPDPVEVYERRRLEVYERRRLDVLRAQRRSGQ